jgi:hypothetical protein
MTGQGDEAMLTPLTLAVATSSPMPAAAATPPPFACRANALDKAQRGRQQALLETVRRTALDKHDLPEGLELRFAADAALFVELAEWVSLERRCCPFLDFALEWKADDSVAVRLTGRPGVKELIAAEMGVRAGQ